MDAILRNWRFNIGEIGEINIVNKIIFYLCKSDIMLEEAIGQKVISHRGFERLNIACLKNITYN